MSALLELMHQMQLTAWIVPQVPCLLLEAVAAVIVSPVKLAITQKAIVPSVLSVQEAFIRTLEQLIAMAALLAPTHLTVVHCAQSVLWALSPLRIAPIVLNVLLVRTHHKVWNVSHAILDILHLLVDRKSVV